MKPLEKERLLLTLLEEYQEKIKRLCLAYLGDPTEAEDLFQEVMINVWNHLEEFRKDAQLSTWVFRIAVNTALMYRRKKYREKEKLSGLKQETAHQFSDPAEEGEDPRLLGLKKAISGLKQSDRLLVSMMLENLSYEEMAEILEITVSNVGVRVNRVKKKLQKRMEEQQNG